MIQYIFSRNAVPSLAKPLSFSNSLMKELKTRHLQYSHSIFSKTILKSPSNFDHSIKHFSRKIDLKPEGNTMKKTEKTGLYLLLAGILLTSISFYDYHNQITPAKPSSPIIFSSIEGKQWVEQCIAQYPEISWLADSNVRKTEEGSATLQGTYSEQLFGQKYVEFDRTVMTLHCLKLILDGSNKAYLKFISAQPLESQLSPESFYTLHLQGQRLLKSKWEGMSEIQMAQAMETALVLGDIGKSEKARKIFKSYGVQAPDHDDFYGEAIPVMMQYPKLCPSFSKLPEPAKELLAEIANIAHYGHITHLEGGLNMFGKLKDKNIPSKDPVALSFDLFVHTCDVAGALGHVNNQSSLVYTESTHQAMQAMAESIKILANPSKNEADAYHSYMSKRADWLGLNSRNSLDRVLVRIGAMLRLFTLEEGIVLKKAIYQLDPITCHQVAAQLDVNSQNKTDRTPTYMPAVLVNLSNNPKLGRTKDKRLSKAITLGLPFIARVLERHKEMLLKNEIDPTIPLNFNKMAGVAKSSPTSLNGEFYIDQEGIICLVAE